MNTETPHTYIWFWFNWTWVRFILQIFTNNKKFNPFCHNVGKILTLSSPNLCTKASFHIILPTCTHSFICALLPTNSCLSCAIKCYHESLQYFEILLYIKIYIKVYYMQLQRKSYNGIQVEIPPRSMSHSLRKKTNVMFVSIHFTNFNFNGRWDNCNIPAFMPRSHQIFRSVLAVKLLGIMFRNRWWPTTFSLLQPEMPTDGVGTAQCDRPLRETFRAVTHNSFLMNQLYFHSDRQKYIQCYTLGMNSSIPE